MSSRRSRACVALGGVELEVRAGEVHCLLGQNGAGKSTLIKVLSGVHKPDSGTVQWLGEEVSFANPQAAMKAGIATIYQELDLVEDMSVAENVYLGHEPRSFGFVNRSLMARNTTGILAQLGHAEVVPDPLGARPVLGGQAAGQHGQSAVAQGEAHHHGRAERGAGPRRGGEPVPHHP